MQDVSKADVLITNSTNYAVALGYDQSRMSVPVVVAVGADLIALYIRRIADANSVLRLEAPPLARALYHNCKLGKEKFPPDRSWPWRKSLLKYSSLNITTITVAYYREH